MNATAAKPKGQNLASWEDFKTELDNRADEIARMLPKHVSRQRFIASALAAVKQTPDLLKATTRSLMAAITKSAQDGLLPDGREGVITVYSTSVQRPIPGSNATERVSEQQAQWNPMTFGLRKRARELDDIIVDAQPVYANDEFLWRQGDNPGIEHTPAPLGTDRGALIGAYAIFRNKERDVLHREVMDRTQIEAVRGQSRAKDSLMWTTFTGEAYKKTVVRRGFKTVPCSEALESIVTPDDDTFSFPAPGAPAAAISPPTATSPPSPPSPPSAGKGAAAEPIEDAHVVEETETAGKAEATTPQLPPNPGTTNPETFLKWVDTVFGSAADRDALDHVVATHVEESLKKMFPPDVEEVRKLYTKHVKRIEAFAQTRDGG